MGKGQENGYWDKRVLKDKARDVNNAEKFLQKNQKVLYAQAAKEIQQEIEKLYGKFTDQQDISIAEARRLIRGADFKKIDWQGMIRESMELREKIREERRHEFVTEHKRYFDILRWKTAEKVLNEPGNGINKDEKAPIGDYTVEQFLGQNRTFDASKHYLWPIPQSARDKNPNLGQNPNW